MDAKLWNNNEEATWIIAKDVLDTTTLGPYQVVGVHKDESPEKPKQINLQDVRTKEVSYCSEWSVKVPKGANIEDLKGHRITLTKKGSRFKVTVLE